MPDSATGEARGRILATAGELFYEHGFQTIGVDLIVQRSGVAKTTLYRHFPSKNDLIAAYLHDSNRQFWEWFDHAIARHDRPLDQLIGLFDAVERLATGPDCRGCTFQVAASEFPEPDHPGHDVALAHKQEVRARLDELAAAVPVRDPTVLADGLMMLMDGAFAATRMYGRRSPASHVEPVARLLIEAAAQHPPT